MNVLVTAGNTLVPIDKVRAITNTFTGRTGTAIALCAQRRGHLVSLLTSHPELVAEMAGELAGSVSIAAYRTFDDLERLLAEHVSRPDVDAVIHCAAISDYRAAGVFAPAPGTRFEDGHWLSQTGEPATLLDRSAGKVKSDEPELWLRLVRTPKLVDRFRSDWGFGGILVKFKLEVGVREEQLLEVAERSRQQSHADLMVANTLEGAGTWAYLGPLARGYQRISRRDLPEQLLHAIEERHSRRSAPE
jgi:phosphopantothenoylcysteine synthetase/decarboxylase